MNNIKCTISIIIFLIFSSFNLNLADAKTKPTYNVNPATKPIDSKVARYSTYNSKTKQYYVLRSYLEKLEKTGGGKLVLKKGTYNISNTLYVPSNVTIQLENGAIIRKSNVTNTSKLKPSHSIFQFIRPSKSSKKQVYGKFNGEKNIKIIGKGNATIDLNYDFKTLGLVIGHNKNITIDNINFKNLNGGHFIELDASNKVVIQNSSFTSSKHWDGHDKEGINLDTPDRNTKGWNLEWSKFDKQANNGVTIKNNVFSGLDRSVGTHKYSEGSLHNNVAIRNNNIQNMRSDGIRVMNWSNPIIEDNVFENIGDKSDLNDTTRGILLSGVSNPIIQNNKFIDVPRAMQFMVWKNTDTGSQYKPIYNKLSESNKKAMQNNIFIDMKEDFIRINNKAFGDYSYPEKVYFSLNQ